MRDTEPFETLISLAVVRVDHCVALVGRLCVVFAIRFAVTSGEIDGVRPGRGNFQQTLDSQLKKTSASKRNHAICLFCSPSLASNTILLRMTTRTDVERPRGCCSSFHRVSSF
jgi:hypothetical protein